jgi:hypothetical protein
VAKYNDFNGIHKFRTNYFYSFSEYDNCFNGKSKCFINIICCKIRSINAHFDDFLLFLENYANSYKIDIIILTETWHDPLSCIYELPRYKLKFSNLKRNQNDGLILFVKQHLTVDFFDYNLLDYNIVKLSFNFNNVPLIILCIYRSPSSDYTSFINSLRDVFNRLNLNSGIITLIIRVIKNYW